MTPRISIIIPCYNCTQWIAETLQSVLAQSIDNWECIVVNDGSTDRSLEIVQAFSKKDRRIRYIDKKNEGVAIARNTAIATARGEFILPLDADDIIAPTYTEKALKHFEKHPSTKLVYCQADFFGSKEGHWNLPEYKYDSFIYDNCIFCSAIFRRDDFLKTAGYNPNMKKIDEDWDLYLSLLEENDEVYCIPETLFFYRQHENSRTTLEPDTVAAARLCILLNHPDIYTKDPGKTWRLFFKMNAYDKTRRKLEKYRRLFRIFLFSTIASLILLACAIFFLS